MKAILLILKGFIMGIANIIPGVSGGTFAIILGIYEKLINILSCFWKNIKENLKFIIPLVIGIAIALIGGSYLIDFGLDHFPIATMMLFIGLIIGGLPYIYIKVHKKYSFLNVSIFIIIAAIVILISLLNMNKTVSLNNISFLLIVKLIFVGMITAATTIIPGVSGSLVLMNMGYYEGIIEALKGLTKISQLWHNIAILLPFGIGVIFGLILIARLIKWLLNKFPIQSYFGILGFVVASIVCILIKIDYTNINTLEIVVGFVLLVSGAFATFFLARYDYIKNKEKDENNLEEIEIEEKKEDVEV